MSKRLDTLVALRDNQFMSSDYSSPMYHGFVMALALTHGLDRFRDLLTRAFPDMTHASATLLYHRLMSESKDILAKFHDENRG